MSNPKPKETTTDGNVLTADMVREAMEELTGKVKAIREECAEHTTEYPEEYGQSCYDVGYQAAMASVASWLTSSSPYGDRSPDGYLRHRPGSPAGGGPAAYATAKHLSSRVRKELQAYLESQSVWLMRSEELPWADS